MSRLKIYYIRMFYLYHDDFSKGTEIIFQILFCRFPWQPKYNEIWCFLKAPFYFHSRGSIYFLHLPFIIWNINRCGLRCIRPCWNWRKEHELLKFTLETNNNSLWECSYVGGGVYEATFHSICRSTYTLSFYKSSLKEWTSWSSPNPNSPFG